MSNATISDRLRALIVGTALLYSGALFAVAKAEGTHPDAGDVARGAISWSENCSRCHEFRDPEEFGDDLLRPIMTHMRVRAGLTGQQQRDILAFLRASNNPSTTITLAGKQAALAAAPIGKQIYNQTCVACHGADGTGNVPGAPDLTAKNGPMSKPDDLHIDHILTGFQTPGSPMAMPAKGGNPELDEAGVRAVLHYIRQTFFDK